MAWGKDAGDSKGYNSKRNPRHKEKTVEEKEIELLQLSYDTIDPSNVKTFEDFPLSRKTLMGLEECGYLNPTEIQQQSIGYSLGGSDILGAAKTGSGKTLAFIIPILEILYCKRWTELDGVGALIITPTRELAYQIFETLRKVGRYHDVSAGLIIGGKDLRFEKKRMDKCNIIVCTPGRLLQHMDENPVFNYNNTQIVILDEADRCLDLGFEHSMNSIFENLPPDRQTLLFSATQTKSVRDLARVSLKDPKYVFVHENAEYSTPDSLIQSYIVCPLHEKLNMLWSFIKSHLRQKILIFLSSCKQVKYYYEVFCRLRPGTSILALNGNMHQLKRMRVYDSFCRKSNAILLATDVAARGLDFPEVKWIVQLDCPEDANTYIHRAGRTARYQKGGETVLVLLPSEEEGMLELLNEKKIPINKIRINPLELRSPIRQIEAFLARDPALKESAQRAFVAYMKNVFLMKNKKVFDVHALNSDLFASSLGLAIPPRIRFIKKHQSEPKERKGIQAEGDSKHTNSNKSTKKADDQEQTIGRDSYSKSSSDEKLAKGSRNNFNFLHDDSDSDQDLFTVKRKNHELDQEIPEPESVKIKKKITTKMDIARRFLKKNIFPNKKIMYDEEGEAIVDPASQYDDEVINGIDIEKAREMLKEEDKIDKQTFREKLKAKRRAEKMKLKGKKDQDEVVDEFGDVEEENDEAPDLSWLPDPDKIYSTKQNNSEDSEINSKNSEDSESNSSKLPYDDEEKEEEIEEEIYKPLKRKEVLDGKTRKKRKIYEDDQSFTSIHCEEELALHLLRNT